MIYMLFFFNDTATTEIYTLSLHDALPICSPRKWRFGTRLVHWCKKWRACPCRSASRWAVWSLGRDSFDGSRRGDGDVGGGFGWRQPQGEGSSQRPAVGPGGAVQGPAGGDLQDRETLYG